MIFFLAESRPLRLTTLCALYAAQGMPDGFVRTGLKTYLIADGASTAAVGNLVALVSWPWALKWVWGPVIDRFGHSSMGRRRPWILAAQFGMGVMLAALLLSPGVTANMRLLGFIVLLINGFAALQDVAVDALAVDLLEEKERGVANGLMFGASYLGSFLGGVVLGGVLLNYGLRTAVAIEIAILLAIAMFPLLLREHRGDAFFISRNDSARRRRLDDGAPASIKATFAQLWIAFTQRSALLAAALAILALVTINAHLVFWPVFLQRQLGWGGQEYLVLEGGYSTALGLLGSLAGGVVASWLGAKRTVVLSLCAVAACWAAYAATAGRWSDKNFVTLLFLVGTALAGCLQVAMFSLFMGVCSKAIAATQFSAYMALLNLSNGLGAVLAGFADAASSLPLVFWGMAALQLGLVVLVLFIDPKGVEENPAA